MDISEGSVLNRSADKQIAMRKYKKDSIIYGIPVKNKNRNQMNASQMGHKENISISISRKNIGLCDKFIIGPDNKMNNAFGFILIILALFSTLLSAYYACFGAPENTVLSILDLVMEACFLLDMIRSFFREYQDEETHKPVRDLKKIAKRYLMSSFIFDLIAISTFPLQQLFKDSWTDQQLSLLYILRLLRVEKIFVILNTQVFQGIIKTAFRSNLNASIARNSTR